jgi:hypothetical protein
MGWIDVGLLCRGCLETITTALLLGEGIKRCVHFWRSWQFLVQQWQPTLLRWAGAASDSFKS